MLWLIIVYLQNSCFIGLMQYAVLWPHNTPLERYQCEAQETLKLLLVEFPLNFTPEVWDLPPIERNWTPIHKHHSSPEIHTDPQDPLRSCCSVPPYWVWAPETVSQLPGSATPIQAVRSAARDPQHVFGPVILLLGSGPGKCDTTGKLTSPFAVLTFH